MKVISSTSFVHEGGEGRMYYFSFPGSFPLQEGYAVCHAICQELEKKMAELQMQEVAKKENNDEAPHCSPEQ